MNRRALAIPVLGLVVASAAPSAAQEKKLEVVFRPATKFFDTEGPMEVVLILRNRTGAAFSTAPGMSFDDGCVVRDRAGNVLPKSAPLEREGAKLPDTIAPDAAFERTVNLRLGYPQLTKPGIYTLTWEHPKVAARIPELRVVPKYDPKASHTVTLDTSMGAIVLDLASAKAPSHVYNFVQLARCGFYDGLTFHRVIDGFMIQGGDPKGDGTGSAGYNLKLEANDLKHERGALAMARASDPNSASCQFYICLAPQPDLDGKYTVFGKVAKGIEVVEAIGKVKTVPGYKPVEPVTIKTVTVEASSAAPAPAEPATPAAPAKP